jgi:hypothetical protein
MLPYKKPSSQHSKPRRRPGELSSNPPPPPKSKGRGRKGKEGGREEPLPHRQAPVLPPIRDFSPIPVHCLHQTLEEELGEKNEGRCRKWGSRLGVRPTTQPAPQGHHTVAQS